MFKKISQIIGSIKEGNDLDDDYDEDYDDEIEEDAVEESRSRRSRRRTEYEEDYDDEDEDYSTSFFDRKKKTSKENQKVIPIRRNNKAWKTWNV